jgi:hypothetical protein
MTISKDRLRIPFPTQEACLQTLDKLVELWMDNAKKQAPTREFKVRVKECQLKGPQG